jgi:hypothetical protein
MSFFTCPKKALLKTRNVRVLTTESAANMLKAAYGSMVAASVHVSKAINIVHFLVVIENVRIIY